MREKRVFPARDLRERSACAGSTYVCIPVSTAAGGAFSVQPAKPPLLLPRGPTLLRFSVWQFRSSCARNEKRAWPGHKSLNPVQSSVSSSRFFSFLPGRFRDRRGDTGKRWTTVTGFRRSQPAKGRRPTTRWGSRGWGAIVNLLLCNVVSRTVTRSNDVDISKGKYYLARCRLVASSLVLAFASATSSFETQGNIGYCGSRVFGVVWER